MAVKWDDLQMRHDNTPANTRPVDVLKLKTAFEAAELGQWYWHTDKDGDRRMMCIVHIGTNYVKVETPSSSRGSWSERVHRDAFEKQLELIEAADATAIIAQQVAHYQAELNANMARIQQLTERLGLVHQAQAPAGGDGKALAVLSSQIDVDAFKAELIEAKTKGLPDLYEENKKLSVELARWLTAPSLPMQAQLSPMQDSISQIEDRIFNIQLYAGIFESIVTVADGAPAASDEKLRIMQRRLYMDEECLLDYQNGGMEFSDMREFDAWLAKPKNRDRILPFPRCMVSMQVRRSVKYRHGHSLRDFLRILQQEKSDKYTYLFVRNGDQVYRVGCDIDFGELMFPEKATFDPTEPLMMDVSFSSRGATITKRDYDDRLEHYQQAKAIYEQWMADNPKESWEAANPTGDWYRARPNVPNFNPSDWEPCTDESVHFDDYMAKVSKEVKDFNRVALIVQGLFDRSKTLMPHPPVKVWQPDSFASAIELIYDGSMVLHWGEAPDFDAYMARLNAQINEDSVVMGQQHYWMEVEAERENRREANNWRISYAQRSHHKLFKPWGNEGPGDLAKMEQWSPRKRTAKFTWMREARGRNGGMTNAQLTVPADRLFNVSAYKPGDYLQFFKDPRTRARYLEWAGPLLVAEEYHAGLRKAQLPLSQQSDDHN